MAAISSLSPELEMASTMSPSVTMPRSPWLASTGTPAFFVHPAEASHGDLGMVTEGDIVLAISNSGESDEIAAIVPALKRLGTTLVAMTGKPDSSLARH